MDSGINSISAVVSTDFIDRFSKEPMSEKKQVRFARILAVVVGVIVVFGSSFVAEVPGNITAVTGKTVNLLSVPIFCLFFFALFYKRASPVGAWVGWFFGTTTAVLIAFSGPIVLWLHLNHGIDPATFGTELIPATEPGGSPKVPDPISFQWITPVALVVNIAVGILFSLLCPRKKPFLIAAENDS